MPHGSDECDREEPANARLAVTPPKTLTQSTLTVEWLPTQRLATRRTHAAHPPNTIAPPSDRTTHRTRKTMDAIHPSRRAGPFTLS
jgi:hypothetical protein